ncbi:hypothetical protein HAX54_028107 [Datura stramonium]|uniref:Uncharacterized protein n=1 Tax=Datura stramonium TaxID=4076 RepID=A0ABS8S9D7_DATST|nr:hypothetical protein [Datura stramonium]
MEEVEMFPNSLPSMLDTTDFTSEIKPAKRRQQAPFSDITLETQDTPELLPTSESSLADISPGVVQSSSPDAALIGSLSDFQQRSSIRTFGIMPHIQRIIPNQIQRGPEIPFPTLNYNRIFPRGESSIQQQLYPLRFQVQPQYLDIGNPFNNPVLSAENNIGNALQQQHTPIFGMLGSQGLHGPIIGNTNYRPDSAFSNTDHDTQSDYNLDLNVAHGPTYSDTTIMSGIGIKNAIMSDYNLKVNADNVTTYSGGAMMSDAYVGNATINDCNLNVNAENVTTYSGSTMMSDTNVGNATIEELKAEHANFQQYIGEPNMSSPSNIAVTSYEIDIEGSYPNESKTCDAYFNFNMDYIFQDLGPPGADLPKEYSSEFDQVYSDDQILALAYLVDILSREILL